MRSRRLPFSNLLLIASTFFFSYSLSRSFAAPNVILLFSDDAGYADFGFMNQFTGQTTEFKTPHLDSLAQQGVKFSNAYVTSPICSASRAGLLTGRYTQKFGFDYNVANANDVNDGIPVAETLITEQFKALGYKTGVVGKWHIGREASMLPQSQGVDEFYGFWGGARHYFNNGGSEDQLVRRGDAAINWIAEPSFNNVPPDPLRGRNLTDAFGDEASKFVATHANQESPFFLYVPFNAAHSPYDVVKQADLAQFNSTTLTGQRKNVAALTYGMDRAIGEIMARVNDPNRDGDTSDSIADETIFVFLNDNGGANTSTGGPHSNAPLKGYKATNWEGGIRTPMIISGPGLSAGIYDQAVSAMDIFPTLVAAAGATAAANIDGVNLLPYLNGQQSGAPHDKLMWRNGLANWAIRKGNWKLVKAESSEVPRLHLLNLNGTGETVDLSMSQPEKYWELMRDYVDWEATLEKPHASVQVAAHRFDVFRHRNLSANQTWRWTNGWANGDNASEIVSIFREDAYANAVLVFEPRNDVSFTSQNNVSRASGISYAVLSANPGLKNPSGLEEFMLNELRFDGEFQGAANRSGTLFGFPLMFVRHLNGQGPRIVLDSDRASNSQFKFTVGMDVVLHADLEITGDSALNYVIGGTPPGNNGQPMAGQASGMIRDFYEPRSVIKNGASSVTFAGHNTYGGNTIVNQGVLRIEGVDAALANTASVAVGSQGTLVLASGLIHSPSIQVASGGVFSFTGGALETDLFGGCLAVNGGEFRPGLSKGTTIVAGSFTLNTGTLAIDIGGLAAPTFDRLNVSGDATLGGTLRIGLVNSFTPLIGDLFTVLSSSTNVSGMFSSIVAPELPAGRKWAVQYSSRSVQLAVVDTLRGDFDGNGIVNQLDLQAWKAMYGVALTGSDFLSWQREYGMRLISAGGVAPVPEPTSATLAFGVVALALGYARRIAAAR